MIFFASPRLEFLVPLRVVASAWLARRRRESAPAGGSLWWPRHFAAQSERPPAARPFAGPNESNQSKRPMTLPYRFGYKLRPMRSHATASRRTHAARLLDAAFVARRCEARRANCSGAPWGASRSAGGEGGARSALQLLTSRGCLSAAPAGREASSARHPHTRAPQSSPAFGRTATVGSPFLCLLSFGEAKESKSAVGTKSRRGLASSTPPSKAEQNPRGVTP